MQQLFEIRAARDITRGVSAVQIAQQVAAAATGQQVTPAVNSGTTSRCGGSAPPWHAAVSFSVDAVRQKSQILMKEMASI